MRSAAAVPAALAMMLAVAGCEPPPPVDLGPQGAGGLASSGQDIGPAAPDTDGGGEDGSGGLPAASGTASIQGQSLLDSGRGADFARVLDPADIPYFQQAEISARGAFVGNSITWRNPGTSTVGIITALSDRTVGGQQCRDFFLVATIGGRQHTATATACNTGSGWVVPA